MILGIFHQGSGLGNQLHRYVATRVLALDKGYDWRMIYNPDGSGKEEGFKGRSFMKIDLGQDNELPSELKKWYEKKIVENGIDIRSYDPEFNFIKDNTIIDGEFQDERYWEHREKEVNEWLKVEAPWGYVDVLGSISVPIVPDDLCVIGFRGGEFATYPDLFLTKEYWDEGIKKMKDINPNMKFEVHTDDEVLAKQFFPGYKVIHDIGINWRSMRFAKYAIIANSSFFIFPRWLNKGLTIAPRYWGRHNIKVWALSQNYYKRFTYI